MEAFVIEGGAVLGGKVQVHGAKNAVLPILAASLLVRGEIELVDVPDLLDVRVMIDILTALGIEVEREGHTLYVNTDPLETNIVPEHLMSQMRSSIFLLGPLVSRTGEAVLSYPGGCSIGNRPIDMHINSLRKMGVTIHEYGGTLVAEAARLRGAHIVLDFPSVGTTENILMAAAFAEGKTIITNAAREPEIQDLARFLTAIGARIQGAGTHRIMIEGVPRPTHVRVTHRVMPDRIVAGTFVAASAMTGGDILICGAALEHMEAVIEAFQKSGADISHDQGGLRVKGKRPIRALHKVMTSPHPGFPTDMQAQLMAHLALAEGTSVMVETVFDGRFRHVPELIKMGADIVVDYHTAVIRGVSRLSGARVKATDLRAGAALVLAGLAAHGTTTVMAPHHIDRGYEKLEESLAAIGARITRERVASTLHGAT